MKEDYILHFKPSEHGVKFHDSYLTALSSEFSGVIKAELKKHKHLTGKYAVIVMMCGIKNSSATDAHILLSGNRNITLYVLQMPHNVCVISYTIDFSSENMLADESDCRYFWINPFEDILKYSPTFKISDSFIIPSEEEIEEQSRRTAERFFKSFDNFRFPCRLGECDFPDVIYEVCFEAQPDSATAEKVLSIIERWAYNYNRRNKDNDRNIHFVQLIEDSEEIQPSGNSVLIHIDFGNCDVLLIRNVIQQLNKSDLPIKGVIIR